MVGWLVPVAGSGGCAAGVSSPHPPDPPPLTHAITHSPTRPRRTYVFDGRAGAVLRRDAATVRTWPHSISTSHSPLTRVALVHPPCVHPPASGCGLRCCKFQRAQRPRGCFCIPDHHHHHHRHHHHHHRRRSWRGCCSREQRWAERRRARTCTRWCWTISCPRTRMGCR